MRPSASNAPAGKKAGTNRGILAAIAIAVVVADQITKQIVVRSLAVGESVSVIQGVVSITHVRNSGAAFGLFRGLGGILALTAIAGFGVFAVILWRRPDFVTGISASLVAGGALGNLLDRFSRGTVVDFVDFGFWPAFNVADSAISVGALLLLAAGFFEGRRK